MADPNETFFEHDLSTAELARAGARAKDVDAPAAGLMASQEPRSFAATDPATGVDPAAPLFTPDVAREFQARWDAIQVSFVDEPRRAVEQADALVAAAMKRQAEIFADTRAELEGQWDRGADVSTEDLRLALRRYRSFFGRLLNI